MFAFLVPVVDRARYDEIAGPALERVREDDSVVRVLPGAGSPWLRVNAALDELALQPDLEGVVVLHDDLALLDPGTCDRLRQALADPSVGVIGLIGTTDPEGLAWWHGEAAGTLRTPHTPSGVLRAPEPTGEVHAVDGAFLCLSPWAVRTLRFDPDLARGFHGYDVDLCTQARYHGRRVVVAEIDAEHRHDPRFRDTERWQRSQLRFAGKWTLERTRSMPMLEHLTNADR